MFLSRGWYYLSSIPTLLWGIKNWPRMLLAFLGRRARRPFVVELRDGSRFHVRTPMDVWVIKETCLDRQYERTSVALENDWVVLDVGAGVGDFAIDAARRHVRSTVYAYEPFPESFALLQENLKLNRVENVRAFPYAICSQPGPLRLRVTSAEAVQHTTVTQTADADAGIAVPALSLDQVFAELRLSRCDYLKMDCEGAEYDILLNAGPATLQKIKHICLEYHDGVTPLSHPALVDFLTQHGFQVRCSPSPVHLDLGLMYAAHVS